MKKLFSLLCIISIVAVSNCTSIPENSDPILGIWVRSNTSTDADKNTNITHEEWIFNDVYLGRYQSYSNSKLEFYTDFRWSEDNGTYTITYGDPQVTDVTVSLEQNDSPERLTLDNGSVFATRD